MKIDEITNIISQLRKSKKKIYTNYYLTHQHSEENFLTWRTENSIVFCVKENKVQRCFFATIDFQDLNVLLREVPDGAVLDYITRGQQDDFPWVESGFVHYNTLIRYTNPDLFAKTEETKRDKFLEQFYEEDFGEFATIDDADELYQLLYDVFDYRVSRLPSREELIEQIEKNWVLLYREDGEIVSFLMYQIEGRKYYGYQLYNKGTADITYNLERRAFKYAIDNYNVRSSYAWIEIENVSAKERIAFSMDGTYDYIFLKKQS